MTDTTEMTDITDMMNIINGIDKNNLSKEDVQMIKFLNIMSSDKDISKIDTPSPLNVSVRSAKCRLTRKLNIKNVTDILYNIIENNQSDVIVGLDYKDKCIGEIKKRKKHKTTVPVINKKFYNQATVIIKPEKDGKNINVKLFFNGSISMTGCKKEDDGIKVIQNLLNEIKHYPDIVIEEGEGEENDDIELEMIGYNITMINTNYRIGFKVDRDKLYKLLVDKEKVYVSYDSSIYQGVKISYMWNKNNVIKDGVCKCEKKCRLEKNLRKKNVCKIVTIAIFQDRNIIITGAQNIKQTEEAYNFINKILYDNYIKIARFSILDC